MRKYVITKKNNKAGDINGILNTELVFRVEGKKTLIKSCFITPSICSEDVIVNRIWMNYALLLKKLS